jgi:hypothetical protein
VTTYSSVTNILIKAISHYFSYHRWIAPMSGATLWNKCGMSVLNLVATQTISVEMY